MEPEERKAQEERTEKGCLIAIVGFFLLCLIIPRDKTELFTGGITILLFGIAIGHHFGSRDQQ